MTFLTQALTGLGQQEEALAHCDKVLQIHPQDVKTWFYKANALGALGRYQEALVCFQKAQKLGDDNAVRGIEQCRRLLKSDAEKLFQHGSDFQQAGNNDEAIRCYDAGLAIDPSNTNAWINKGAALLTLKQSREAIVCFDRAIALSPGDSGAWNNKGYALFFIGEYSAALPVLEEAQRLGATRCASMIAVCRDRLGR